MNIYASRENPIDRVIGKDIWFYIGGNVTAPYWVRIVKVLNGTYQCNGISDIIIRRLDSKTEQERIEVMNLCLSRLRGFNLDSWQIEDAIKRKEFLTTDELFKLV